MKKQSIFLFLFSFLIINQAHSKDIQNPDHLFKEEDSISVEIKSSITSGNPIITHIRCADPAAEVWNDGRVWIYSSHDEDDATDYSTIDGYHVFSSNDLVNWTDHGEILNSSGVSWGNPNGGFMFAPDAAYKNGIYYLYFPHLSNEWRWRIGVATSTKPEGPFTDIGRYIANTDNIDPVCFMDDDGQAYLIWGGGSESPKIARLKENMTDLAETPRIIDYGGSNFGEGPYMHKRNGVYYFSYTCNTCYPYQGFYSMGDNPYGPFEYKGALNPNPPGAQDHHSIIEYHNQWYYFYHVGNYGADGSIYRRNISVDSLFYNEDGTMREIVQTKTGVAADLIGSTPGIIVPGRIEAEDFFRQKGIETEQIASDSIIVSQINDGDWFEFVIDILGSEIYSATIKVSEPTTGTAIYLSVDDRLKDTIDVDASSDTIATPIFLNKGKHTLKLSFDHSDTTINLMDVDWIDLFGDKEYFSIEASSSEGGAVSPEGISYFESGDSAVFKIEADFNYIMDSLIIDEFSQSLSDTYTFYNLSENHTIQAYFSECQNTVSNPYYQLNDNTVENGTQVSITEGEDLKLIVHCEDVCSLSWILPGGITDSSSELIFDSINANQKGIYKAIVKNNQGCVTEYPFNVSVKYLELDVFEAENYLDQSGIGVLSCTDIGGGKYLTSLENNDYCYYRVNVDSAGYYDLTTRVATSQNGGNIEISNTDSLIAIIPVEDFLSDGDQDWYTTEPVEIGLQGGYNRLKFTFKGEEGFLFNLNWFDLAFKRTFEQSTSSNSNIKVKSYPNPFISSTQISFSLEEASKVDLEIFNSSGAKVKSLISSEKLNPGMHIKTWNATDNNKNQLTKGVYVIRFQCNNAVIVKKVILL